jgi:hypothetical protein
MASSVVYWSVVNGAATDPSFGSTGKLLAPRTVAFDDGRGTDLGGARPVEGCCELENVGESSIDNRDCESSESREVLGRDESFSTPADEKMTGFNGAKLLVAATEEFEAGASGARCSGASSCGRNPGTLLQSCVTTFSILRMRASRVPILVSRFAASVIFMPAISFIDASDPKSNGRGGVFGV